jgi:hypothetical protein
MVERRYRTEQIPAGLAEPGTLLAVGPKLDREIFRVDVQTLRGEGGVEKVVLEQHNEHGGPPWVLVFDPDQLVTRLR